MKPQALFLSHGGGPLPLLGDAGHAEMVACLKRISARIPRPLRDALDPDAPEAAEAAIASYLEASGIEPIGVRDTSEIAANLLARVEDHASDAPLSSDPAPVLTSRVRVDGLELAQCREDPLHGGGAADDAGVAIDVGTGDRRARPLRGDRFVEFLRARTR